MSTESVMTVLGPVPAAALGVVDAHSHLYIAPVPGGAADAPVLVDEAGVGRELAAFRAAGGGAVVDCQPGGCGRDGRVLRRLSESSGVHVVAATGFHRRVYYPPDAPLFGLSATAAADYFRDEIANGLAETRGETSPLVYPGVIKIAAEASLEASPPALFEAAAAVAKETGYAIEMHTERGAAVEAFLAFFGGQGLSPRRLVFCHVDKRPDFGLHRELARAGVMLEYDTFFRPKYDPERTVWPLIGRMAAAGLAEQVALATDMADPALWAELGGRPGLLGVFTIIKDGLARMGLPPATIDGLLGGNIARRLVITEDGRLNRDDRK
jgi:phosphotriesterase-related protein